MFDKQMMNCLAYANGFTMWHYRTPDKWVDVMYDEDYWATVVDDTGASVNDMIIINGGGFNITAFLKDRYGDDTLHISVNG